MHGAEVLTSWLRQCLALHREVCLRMLSLDL